jgi:branched-chain amino acid transport system permease protein
LIYTIIALGVHLTFAAGILSMAYGGFVEVGAYTAAILATRHHTGLVVSTLGAAGISAAIALVIVQAVLRARGIQLALMTFGFTLLVDALVTNGGSFTAGQFGISVPRTVSITDLIIVIALIAVVVARIERSVHGVAMEATRQDELAASALGIHARRYMVTCFVASSAIAGVGGAMLAQRTYFIGPGIFAFSLTLQILLFVMVGGAYKWYGALLGAFFLTYLSNELIPLIAWQTVVQGAILMIAAVALPRGFAGVVDRGFKLAREASARRREAPT